MRQVKVIPREKKKRENKEKQGSGGAVKSLRFYNDTENVYNIGKA